MRKYEDDRSAPKAPKVVTEMQPSCEVYFTMDLSGYYGALDDYTMYLSQYLAKFQVQQTKIVYLGNVLRNATV